MTGRSKTVIGALALTAAIAAANPVVQCYINEVGLYQDGSPWVELDVCGMVGWPLFTSSSGATLTIASGPRRLVVIDSAALALGVLGHGTLRLNPAGDSVTLVTPDPLDWDDGVRFPVFPTGYRQGPAISPGQSIALWNWHDGMQSLNWYADSTPTPGSANDDYSTISGQVLDPHGRPIEYDYLEVNVDGPNGCGYSGSSPFFFGGLGPGRYCIWTFVHTQHGALRGWYPESVEVGYSDSVTGINLLVPGDSGPPGARPWLHRDSLPGAVKVKDSGSLSCDASNGTLYAVKGNRSLEFFAYRSHDSGWVRQADVPPGAASKGVSGGGSASWCGGNVFLTKGNGTLEFYRYNTSTGRWETPRATVPEGPKGRKAKGGTSMTCVEKAGRVYAYLLKGNTTEFYRYDVTADTFVALEGAPTGAKPKYGKGSWIAYDGERYIYCHKGKYGEFYRYDVLAEAWVTTPALPSMPLASPLTHKEKKLGDGSCAAWANGALYALKGNNTQEFWRYTPAAGLDSGSWTEMDSIPQAEYPLGRKKKVKAGAALAYNPGANAFFALKGNKTNQFWKYTPGNVRACVARPPRVSGAGAGAEHGGPATFSIAPNPLAGPRVLRLTTGPLDRPATVSIFDALGHPVLIRRLGHSASGPLVLPDLPAGVYVVRLTSGQTTATRKLVIQR